METLLRRTTRKLHYRAALPRGTTTRHYHAAREIGADQEQPKDLKESAIYANNYRSLNFSFTCGLSEQVFQNVEIKLDVGK